MYISVTDVNSFIKLSDAKLQRIAKERGDVVRINFVDNKRNCVQVELPLPNYYHLRERLNKRKDI